MRSLWGVGPAGPIHFGYDTAALAQLELVRQGLELSARTKQGFFRPDMLRVEAEIALGLGQIDLRTARARLESAIALAREQSALALEWRAACSLAQLLADNGELPEARQLLGGRYAAFSEGFDTRDLQAGKRLLVQLA